MTFLSLVKFVTTPATCRNFSALTVILTLLFGGQSGRLQAADKFAPVRHHMVKEFVEREGVQHPEVLRALRTVPRHEFVTGRYRDLAYQDGALPIGSRQTISPPYIVAYMTEVLDPQRTDRVLEIGTGSGYQAAVLAEIVQDVYSIEIVDELGKSAAKRLKRLGYANVKTKVGDGYQGWAAHAPFDKIIVTCSPESVPRPLVQQLREGGKMVVPVGQRYQQMFVLFEKQNGKLVETKLIPTLFVPMTGISEANRRIKPDPIRPVIFNPGFETDENKDGRADGWHYQRQTELVEVDDPREGSRCLLLTNESPGRLAQVLQGLPLDGKRIGAVRLQLWARYEDIVPAGKFGEAAALVHFYDNVRRDLGTAVVGKFRGSIGWQSVGRTIPVPPKTKEIIIRVGLNGATGRLWADALQLQVQPRNRGALP